MATRFYLANSLPAFTPTIKGIWHTIAPSGGKVVSLDVTKSGGEFSSESVNEGSFGGPVNHVIVLRAVSKKLSAQTIAGNVNLVLGVLASSPTVNYNWLLFIYVTQGDTNLIRGYLVNGYNEGGPAVKWPTTAQGKSLASTNDVTPVTALIGDRIVAEIGYRESLVTDPLNFGTIHYGAPFGSSPDLTVNDTLVTIHPGFIEFSQNIVTEVDPSIVGHVVPQVARAAPANNSFVGHVVTQIARSQPPAPSLVGHVVNQIARTVSAAPAALSHVVIQVVPTAISLLPDVSGLYYINPSKSGFHDSLYNLTEVRIPDPTIKTAFLGE